MSLQPTTLLSSDSPCSHCFFSAVLPLNFSGAKLFSSAGSRMQLLVAVRRWKQGPDWPWTIYPSLTFMGASLRQNSYYLCARCLALNVFTTSAHEEPHRVTLWILCCFTFPCRQTIPLYSVAERWMILFDLVLSPLSWGLAFVPCVQKHKYTEKHKRRPQRTPQRGENWDLSNNNPHPIKRS